MSGSPSGDYFERVRAIAASILFAAGAAALIGALLDWVVVAERPPSVPANQLHRLPPFSGLEVTHGWYVIVGACVVLASAFMIVIRGRPRYAWIAFLACMVIGAIAISHYRGIDDVHLALEGIGRDPRPGLGLTLVTAAGLIGLIASVAAIAASPGGTSD